MIFNLVFYAFCVVVGVVFFFPPKEGHYPLFRMPTGVAFFLIGIIGVFKTLSKLWS